MANSILFSFVIFSLSFVFALASPKTLSNAVETLSNSGYLSMALTLQITVKTLNLDSETITIFAPSDFCFDQSGQLSLFQLQCHISPVRLSQDSLKTLGFGSRIPTLSSNHPLIVTASDQNKLFSINGVLIQESPIFEGTDLVIYGMDEFFNSSFHVMISSSHSPPEPVPAPSPSLTTEGDHSTPHPAPVPATSPSSTSRVDNSFEPESSGPFDVYSQASDRLNSRGYKVMATFLDMQLERFENQTRLTIFAPVDEAMETCAKNITDYVSIFRQHVVPRLLQWQGLVRLEDGTMLQTCSQGFMINVTRSGDVIMLNGVPVVSPGMYSSNCLVVHGLHSLLVAPALEEKVIGESFSEFDGEDYHGPPDYA